MTRRVALVTGAARGIGRGVAEALAASGFALALVDRLTRHEAAAIIDAMHAAGAEARYFEHDISDIEAAPMLAASVVAAFGRIDCLVNNAGIQSPVRGDILDLAPEDFDAVLDINLRGTFFLTQAVAAWMTANEDRDAYRSVHFITSTNAAIPAPTRSAYCVSKAGLAMVASIFALRMAPHGVHVFEIRPGTIRTDMTRDVAAERNARIAAGAVPIARWGEPMDIGRAVATLADGALPFVTGAAIFVDGGGNLRPN